MNKVTVEGLVKFLAFKLILTKVNKVTIQGLVKFLVWFQLCIVNYDHKCLKLWTRRVSDVIPIAKYRWFFDILWNQLELDMRKTLYHRIGSRFYEQELTKTSTKTHTHMEVPIIVKLNRLKWKEKKMHQTKWNKTEMYRT